MYAHKRQSENHTGSHRQVNVCSRVCVCRCVEIDFEELKRCEYNINEYLNETFEKSRGKRHVF